jgi:hypothetical protein
MEKENEYQNENDLMNGIKNDFSKLIKSVNRFVNEEHHCHEAENNCVCTHVNFFASFVGRLI